MIKLFGISHQYEKETVLNSLNLQIAPGKIFGLLGPSGAGKTTLINILTGQLKQTGGTAFVFGKDTRNLDNADYQKIGVMMEHFGFYDRLSVYDNLKIFAGIYRVSDKEIPEILNCVGLLEAKNRRTSDLSKGMRGRLLLARVLLAKPSVLFLDEPTSGLDPATANRIHQLILQEKDKGNTIFLTTHNMAEAAKLCDEIALLYEGRLIEYGSPKEICRRYNHQRKIKLHLFDGQDVELANNSHSAETLAEYLREGKLETIHSTEPDLETVFMELTGRGLD